VTDVDVLLEYYRGCHRKTSAGTLFLKFFHKVTIAIKRLLNGDALYQKLLILNLDC